LKEPEHPLLDRITDAFVALDEEWRFVFVNPQAAEILERERLDLLGKVIWDESPSLVGEPFHEACLESMAQQTPLQIERFSISLNRWIENRIYPSFDGMTIFFTDITERKSREASLRRYQDIFHLADTADTPQTWQGEAVLQEAVLRLEALIGSLLVGVLVEDSQGRILLTNQALCDMLGVGIGPGALAGARMSLFAQHIRSLFADPDRLLTRLAHIYDERRPCQSEELLLNDGRVFEMDYSPVSSEDGSGYHLWQLRDVTDRRQLRDTSAVLEAQKRELEAQKRELEEANARLEALATTDGLTGLLNQRAFGERLAEEFRRARRYGEPLSLILLDVDHFKTYNDSFGHLAGNAALKRLAEVLREHARETDLVARFGGEEFTLILPHTVGKEAVALAERLRSALEETVWNAQYPITASFGVCTLTPETDGPETLIARADAAMYCAKSDGRNRVSQDKPL
jgi:diguanylate cyclase (GGDEF)-like protein/PAS domain S-box-containing protein